MDLGSMLNAGAAPANLEEEAISTYRRLSTGSATNSPVPSPQPLNKPAAFAAPDLPTSSPGISSRTLKRKIDQIDRGADDAGDGVKADGAVDGTETRRDAATASTTTAPTPADNGPARPPPPQQQRHRLDLAYNGARPLDELTRIVKSAIMHYLTVDQRTYGKLGMEIEAKLGRILSRESGRRMHDEFPFNSTTLLHPGFAEIQFESKMTEQEHSKFNQLLNQEVETRNPKHPRFDASRPKMTYEHTHLTDAIYASFRQDGMEVKPRVTTNDKDGSVVEIISKENITNLHICCPHYPFDVRLSINLEHQVPAPTNASPVLERQKDRLSYKLATHRIDLTKVGDKRNAAARGKAQGFELEVEMTEMENLKRQAELELDERPNLLDDVLTGFLGTVLALNRAAIDFA